jgi:Glycosyltransferase
MRDYCRIVGRLKAGKEVFEFLDSLDLYLHPSRQEGLPRAVIEAMSRGCPVLASSIAGIPELLAPEFLHKPGDSKKLSDDIIAVLSDVNLREKMAITNFKTAKEYNKEILEERREAFFNAVVSTLS